MLGILEENFTGVIVLQYVWFKLLLNFEAIAVANFPEMFKLFRT